MVSIIVCFLIYANNFDISSKPSPTYNGGAPKQEPVIVTDSEGASVTDAEGNMVVEMSDIEESKSESANPVPESEAQPESYLNSCMFIGDSITTGLSVYKLVPSDNVFADVGLRIDKINETAVKNTRFDEPVKVMTAIEEVRPENIYILLGSNGVAWYNNDSMIEAYGTFVDDIKTKLPDSKIYIISLTPVGTMKENIDTVENGKVLNSEIDQFNARLLELANQKNVYYIDVNSELKDASGKLPDDVTRDGMHFTLDVYKKFVNYILTHTAK
ncbi:MAG: hypothetical protein J6U36_00830 [Oscillospiraceae bacterium]|nr:hypothetical protein [Oscillospiraceae bacterium]